MTIKEILEERRTVAYELKALERQLDLHTDIGKPRGVGGGIRRERMPGPVYPTDINDRYVIVDSRTNNGAAMKEQQADWYEVELERLRSEKKAIIDETERIIASLRDGRARAILRDYYCTGLSDEQIGRLMDTDRGTVWRKRMRIVGWLERNFEKV